MTVYIPGPLRSYTGGASTVEAEAPSVAELLRELDRRYPGFRFRIINEQDGIREHIRIFVNREEARSLEMPLEASSEVQIICAISGG